MRRFRFHGKRPGPPPTEEESPYAPFDTPCKMALEVERRRRRRFPLLKDFELRPLISGGWTRAALFPLRVDAFPSNEFGMVPFQVLFWAGRAYGSPSSVQAWLWSRLGDDLARGEVESLNTCNPVVRFEATTMVPVGAVEALDVWMQTLDTMIGRACDLLRIYHGFLYFNAFEDARSFSPSLGKLLHGNPGCAAAEILRRKWHDLHGTALAAAGAAGNWKMVLEVVRRMGRDPRAPDFRNHLMGHTLRAWFRMGRIEDALGLARRALPRASDEATEAMLRTAIAVGFGRLSRWRESFQAAEEVPVAVEPRAAWHRAFALLHCGKRKRAKLELEAYHEAAGRDLYADLRFRALEKRLGGRGEPPRLPLRGIRPGG